MLDFDARIDSTIFAAGKGARELFERYSTFMDRFYVGRWKRWVFIEPFSEAATIGLGGTQLLITDTTGKVNDHTFITAMGLLRVGMDTMQFSGGESSIRDKIDKMLSV